MKLPVLASALLLTLILVPGTRAGEAVLSVQDPYVRLVPPGIQTTGGFMLIRNSGTADRRLVRAESPAAKIVELHNHINENGVMKMRQVSGIDVKAGGHAELKPGSFHIMLIDLKQPLKEGESIPITLGFDDGSSIRLDAPVRKPQTAKPDASAMQHGMGGMGK